MIRCKSITFQEKDISSKEKMFCFLFLSDDIAFLLILSIILTANLLWNSKSPSVWLIFFEGNVIFSALFQDRCLKFLVKIPLNNDYLFYFFFHLHLQYMQYFALINIFEWNFSFGWIIPLQDQITMSTWELENYQLYSRM